MVQPGTGTRVACLSCREVLQQLRKMFNGDDPSYDGHRGHNNTAGWRDEQFGHDKLKYRFACRRTSAPAGAAAGCVSRGTTSNLLGRVSKNAPGKKSSVGI